jgi:hypothetical protein
MLAMLAMLAISMGFTMKRVAILAVALALAACGDDNGNPAGPSATGPIIFTAQMSAANEVPPVTNAESGGRGTASITLNVPRDSSGNVTGGGNVTFNVQVTGFPPGTAAIAAHIHPGAAGVNGSVLVPVVGLSAAAPFLMADGSGSTSFTTSTITQQQAEQIVANPANFYFNVHTPLNPGGAIRGQLSRVQ